jgi:hypothetical protein
MMNWRGHGHEYQPWLQSDGWWLLVPVYEWAVQRITRPEAARKTPACSLPPCMISA